MGKWPKAAIPLPPESGAGSPSVELITSVPGAEDQTGTLQNQKRHRYFLH